LTTGCVVPHPAANSATTASEIVLFIITDFMTIPFP
jgi:hypothetical protein